MKKLKRILKITLIFFSIIVATIFVGGFSYYKITTRSLSLDEEKLNKKTSLCLKILDVNGNEIQTNENKYISLSSLSNNTINAFICAEDKRFYSHKGIDYIRVAGAIASNIKTKSFSEGASTISQQLIKNTQLTNEKTIKRKMKELKMTKQLEKKYSKNDILELYLNNIYFGHGCYGIESAANYYFNKSAQKLTLDESALLAGIINAPKIYDPTTNEEKSKTRRNLILNLMNKYGKITQNELENAKIKPINLNISKNMSSNYIYNEVLDEAVMALKTTENNLKNKSYIIHTSIDLNLQKQIENDIKTNYSNVESSPKIMAVIADNKNYSIKAIAGKPQEFNSKKQPGSVIKPLLVYGPCIEENIISPSTEILDEKINICGYSPKNADKKYHGKITAKNALANSLNVPAVKLLNEIGIEKAQSFANKFNINFSSEDNNLSIALGAITNGVSPKTISEAYTSLANNGKYQKYSFINNIEDNGKIIYKKIINPKQIIKNSTAYLLTDMLIQTTKTGTAKRLKDFNFQIASKTGTVGIKNSKQNSESYCVSYTNDDTILTYFGGTTMPQTINGSTYPTMLTKDILNYLYKNKNPNDFSIPSSVEKTYETNENGKNEIQFFDKNNVPNNLKNIDISLNVTNLKNRKPILNFICSNSYEYKIIRINKNKEEVINTSSPNQYQKIIFEDKSAKSNEIYEYFVRFCDKNSNETKESNHIKLKTF